MLWIKTVVHTSTAGIEPVSGILLLNGINGYEVCDNSLNPKHKNLRSEFV